MRTVRLLLSFVALVLPLAVQAQNPCSTIQAAKRETYGFNPAKLDQKGREAKSHQMDAFWKLVKAQKTVGVTCLQDLLTAEKSDGFFLFDGSSLLYSLDQSKTSTRVVLDGLERADLDEIDLGGYLELLLRLSNSGVDVGPLARRYLEHPEVKIYVPQHAMTIERDTGALFVYGSMPLELADRYLIAALRDRQPYARAVAALLLAINMTEDSFKALAEFKGFDELPQNYKKEIQAYRTYSPYKPPANPTKFTREEVLEYIRLIPHTNEEFDARLKRQEEYEKQHPDLGSSPKADSKDLAKAISRKIEESPPFIEISGHNRFIGSAIVNLTEADLPLVREARRKSVHGLSDESLYEFFAYTQIIEGIINRLDLYKEYRIH